MKPHLECVPCMLRQAREAIAYSGVETEAGFAVLRRVLRLMSELDWTLPPPFLAQQVHRLIRQSTGNPDPYAAIKERMNQQAAKLYPMWHTIFRQAHSPLDATVRVAIVGNLLDVGAKTQLDAASVRVAFEGALSAPLRGSMHEFAEAIRSARSILYLADNAGEIVFDRDLLAQLPLGKFVVAVRGSPVLNDATVADAEQAGLPDYCEIISNGSDAPGIVLEDCSPAFREQFAAADLIIAKGQGNYESLSGVAKEIFFLLKIKCDVLSQDLRWPLGSLVLHHHRPASRIRSDTTSVRTESISRTAEP
jgi:damage-control phosphatase, subfamily I